MSDQGLRILSLLGLLCAGSIAVGASPAFACHQDTGWCCIDTGGGGDGHYFCCYWENNEMNEGSCMYME
jgi:hypothetical protein